MGISARTGVQEANSGYLEVQEESIGHLEEVEEVKL